ncbi:MAG TPA: hypothetical protein VII93_03705 [Anaerolineales bacterium]
MSYNSFRCTHKLVKKSCPHCGADFLNCPVCHPDTVICGQCERPRVALPSALAAFYRVSEAERGIVISRKERARLKANQQHRKYCQQHKDELHQKAHRRYYSNLEESRVISRERNRRWLIRRQEMGIPGEAERRERHRISRCLSDQRCRERVRAERRRWAENHRELKRLRDRAYAAAHQAEISQRQHAWYERHKEQIKQRRRERYHAGRHPEL